MITDHCHYFHSGGEAYHTLFDSWELERGQEGDQWHPLVKEPEIPEFIGKNRRPYWGNREFMNAEQEEDYPTPRCLNCTPKVGHTDQRLEVQFYGKRTFHRRI